MTKLGFADPENFMIFSIDDLKDVDWRKPIVEYLEILRGLTDQKVKYMYSSYVIIGNNLFKKIHEGI